MAMKVLHRERPQPDEFLAPPESGWTAAAEEVVPVPLDLAEHIIRDTPSWALWNPGIVQVEHREGVPGEEGMLCRLSVGNRRLSSDMLQMLIGSSDHTTIFAGGGHRWRFIEVIRLRARGRHATAIHRRVEIHLCGRARWFGSLVRMYAARHLRRSLSALS
jgi:hypothetical protein